MKKLLSILILAGLCIIAGCEEPSKFATASVADPNPEVAARKAAELAIKQLGDQPVKGLIFSVYYEKPSFVPQKPGDYMPDAKKELIAAQTVARIAQYVANRQTLGEDPKDVKSAEPKPKVPKKKDVPTTKPTSQPATKPKNPIKTTPPRVISPIPNIGLRSRSFVNANTKVPNSVSVLAIGGNINCKAVEVPILKDRSSCGDLFAQKFGSKDMKQLRMVLAFSEMTLNFDPTCKTPPLDFLKRAKRSLPKGTVVIGGNSMNDPAASKEKSLEGGVFINGKRVTDKIVAMGIAGDIKVFTSQDDEFQPVNRMMTVTESRGPWVISLDNRPAADVYRQLAGMELNEPFTCDWRHPIGVVLNHNRHYLRMIVNWIGPNGKDRNGKKSPLPPGSLLFGSNIAVGSQVKILVGGNSAKEVLNSGKRCVAGALAKAKKDNKKPAMLFVFNCCARQMRLEALRSTSAETLANVLTHQIGKNPIPMFGVTTFGQFGPVGGNYLQSNHHFQQHNCMAAVIANP